MIQANQVNDLATFDTLSSFLRSSPASQIWKLSIQQIDLLQQSLSIAYLAPVTGNQRPRAAMEQTLKIRRAKLEQTLKKQREQLEKRQVEARQSAEQRKTSLLTLVAAYFVALAAISSCFKSTSFPITNDGKVETVGPQAWELSIGWLGIIVFSALAIFVYREYIR